MFNCHITTIPHQEQRYDTVGDWQWEPGTKTLNIRVSDLGNWKFEALVAYHEFIEVVLCEQDGVTEEQVDRFDLSHPELEEPGNDPRAPYHHQHVTATRAERVLARMLEVDWGQYEKALEQLEYNHINEAT